MDNHWLPLLFPVRHHCLHYIWLDRLCTSRLNRTYPSWFIPWPASQSQISLVSLLAVRHGTFEMKLLVLAETQRSVEMTIDVVAELKMALLAITVLSWFISNWSTSQNCSVGLGWGVWPHFACATVWSPTNLWVTKEADLVDPLTKLFILFSRWSSVLSPWIPDSGGGSTDLKVPAKKIKKCIIFWKLIEFSYSFCVTTELEIDTSTILEFCFMNLFVAL